MYNFLPKIDPLHNFDWTTSVPAILISIYIVFNIYDEQNYSRDKSVLFRRILILIVFIAIWGGFFWW